ncbi:MAG: pyruvate kinase [Candidatus Woesearchaeota archaeon]
MNYIEKNTKIVATISDLRCDQDFIRSLHEQGMNVCRLNTAHMTLDGIKEVVSNVRAVSDNIPLMVDTKGPEIRIGDIKDTEVVEGEFVYFVAKDPQEGELVTSYEQFIYEVPKGAQILVNDGQISFTVIDLENDRLKCLVENSATVKKKKSVNVPNVHFTLPSLTEKDKDFLKVAQELGIEFVAHSFVRNKEDLMQLQSYLDSIGAENMKIISKIENREGVDNIEEILDNCYGIMVARGDLGIEVPAAEIPLIQKQLVAASIARTKPVIVATHMLESMIDNPRATRAEISDVANAILDGTSAVMLSGETAYGKYPVNAVRTMSEVAMQLHDRPRNGVRLKIESPEDVKAHLAKSAVEVAIATQAKAIIVPTISGITARYISAMRSRIPVYALCYDPVVKRQLWLSHGIRAIDKEMCDTTDSLVKTSIQAVKDSYDLADEDTVIVLSGTPKTDPKKSMFLEVVKVKDVL